MMRSQQPAGMWVTKLCGASRTGQEWDGEERMQHLRQERRLRPALPGVLVLPIPTVTPVACRPAGNSAAPEPASVLRRGSAVGPAHGPGKGLGRRREWGRPCCFWESTGVRRGGTGIAPGWQSPTLSHSPPLFTSSQSFCL